MCGLEPKDDLLKKLLTEEQKKFKKLVDSLDKQKHLSAVEFVNQNARGK